MSMRDSRFTAIAAEFITDHLAPLIAGLLAEDAAAQPVVPNDDRDVLRARLLAWLREIEEGRADAALAPERLADALEILWLFAIVAVRTPAAQTDPDWVDVLMTPAGARAIAIADAATRALDLLRGTDVAGVLADRQLAQIERIAALVGAAANGRNLH